MLVYVALRCTDFFFVPDEKFTGALETESSPDVSRHALGPPVPVNVESEFPPAPNMLWTAAVAGPVGSQARARVSAPHEVIARRRRRRWDECMRDLPEGWTCGTQAHAGQPLHGAYARVADACPPPESDSFAVMVVSAVLLRWRSTILWPALGLLSDAVWCPLTRNEPLAT